MSAKKMSVVRKEPSNELLQAFMEGGGRLGEVLRTPDIRLVTQSDLQETGPSPVAVLQEQVAVAVQQPPVELAAPPTAPVVAPPSAPAAALIAAEPSVEAVSAPIAPIAPAAPIAPQQPLVAQPLAQPVAQAAVSVQPQAEANPAAPAPAMPAHLEVDAMSLELPVVDGAKAQHLYGRRGQKAVDFNLSLTQEQADRLNELTAYEMLRTRSKHSISEIVRHLVDFALHHVEENRVIPTADGLGLHKQQKGA